MKYKKSYTNTSNDKLTKIFECPVCGKKVKEEIS